MNRISALILDWAGTTVDFGSFAPTQIFVEAFRQAFDIEITLEEARVPMGLGKWQHIEALGKLPAVDSRWQAKFGRAMTAPISMRSTPRLCRCKSLRLSIFPHQ